MLGFRSGDGAQYGAAKLRSGIREANRKMGRYSTNNTRRGNNLFLNPTKTKELTVDFRRKRKTDIRSLIADGDCVERVSDFHVLGVQVKADLTGSHN